MGIGKKITKHFYALAQPKGRNAKLKLAEFIWTCGTPNYQLLSQNHTLLDLTMAHRGTRMVMASVTFLGET